MSWKKYLFKPSSLITFLLALIFIVLAIVTSGNEHVSKDFYEIISSSMKILAGALAGAVAGEKYVEADKDESP